MKYNFDEIVPRRHTNSYKWDSAPAGKEVLPLWVADMDFRTAPAVVDALERRVRHGILVMSVCRMPITNRSAAGSDAVMAGRWRRIG